MKALTVILFFSTILSAGAQFRHPVFDDHQTGYSVGTYGRYQLASNALSVELAWKTYTGQSLDRKIRESASKRLGRINGFGADVDFGIYARHLPDSAKGLGWYVNVSDRSHANAKYNKDLFDIIAFGNAMFADRTANLSDIQANYISYKQFEAGILKHLHTSNGTQWRIGFGLSLLTGNRNFQLRIDKATLYTDPDGEYLDGEIHGHIRSSSIASSQYFDANGLGLSTAFHVGYEAERFAISVDADDMGFIRYDTRLKRTDLDSVFRFEGVEMQLFGNGDGGFASINLDSVVSGFATEREGTAYTVTVPGRIRLEAVYKLKNDRLYLYAGIQYRIADAYVPYGYIGTRSELPKGFYVDGRVAYGGFGSWHVGLELRKRFGDFLEVRLGTNNLEGYILPMVGTTQSAYLSLAGYF